MLSDAITSYGDSVTEKELTVLANGCLTASHATQFVAYVRQVRNQYSIRKLFSGEQRWPDKPEERDVLYFLAQSFRSQLLKELPKNRGNLSGETARMAMRAKELLIELASVSVEIAQMAVTEDNGKSLPAWFVVDTVRDVPGLAKMKQGKPA